MTKKHATYYTDADTRQSLIDIGMKAGAKEGRAASLGLRISAAYHERLVEALREAGRTLTDGNEMKRRLAAKGVESLLAQLETGKGGE